MSLHNKTHYENSVFIYLDSRDNLHNADPYDCTWLLGMNQLDFRGTKHIQLDEACFVNGVYPINANNNSLVYEENAGNSTTTTTIDHATINNSQYQYYIQADLPDWGASGRVTLFCVVIEYNFPVYMPIVVK